MSTFSEPTAEEKLFRIYGTASVGAAIRHFRKQAGLTQADLAERAGINRMYLSRLEGGHETEQLRNIFRVLGQLGVRATLRHEDW